MEYVNARALAIELVSLLIGRDRTVSIGGIRGYGLGVEAIVISVDEAEAVAERFVQNLIDQRIIRLPDEDA